MRHIVQNQNPRVAYLLVLQSYNLTFYIQTLMGVGFAAKNPVRKDPFFPYNRPFSLTFIVYRQNRCFSLPAALHVLPLLLSLRGIVFLLLLRSAHVHAPHAHYVSGKVCPLPCRAAARENR